MAGEAQDRLRASQRGRAATRDLRVGGLGVSALKIAVVLDLRRVDYRVGHDLPEQR